jgi:hypothetical protein
MKRRQISFREILHEIVRQDTFVIVLKIFKVTIFNHIISCECNFFASSTVCSVKVIV